MTKNQWSENVRHKKRQTMVRAMREIRSPEKIMPAIKPKADGKRTKSLALSPAKTPQPEVSSIASKIEQNQSRIISMPPCRTGVRTMHNAKHTYTQRNAHGFKFNFRIYHFHVFSGQYTLCTVTSLIWMDGWHILTSPSRPAAAAAAESSVFERVIYVSFAPHAHSGSFFFFSQLLPV